MLLIAGPAFAVSIGYVDPGNWATDLAAGRYGAALLWVVILSGAIAAVLQMLTVRLTFATGETFAESIARRWPHARTAFFAVSQSSAIATDIAEFTGIVVGLKLIFPLPTAAAALIAASIVIGLLSFGNSELRRIELFLMAFLGVIALGYVYEVGHFHPAALSIVRGVAIPSIPAPGAYAVALGIIGATVMPHNLFLHSALVRERLRRLRNDAARGMPAFCNETIVALAVATMVNAAILIVGAAIGGADGSIERAYRTIAPLAGIGAAAVFGGTLLCAGIAASTTATIAGDSIARDLAPVQAPRWARRTLTLAPAVGLILLGADPTALLLWSQIALAIALPFVVVPLLVLYRARLSRMTSREF